MMEVLIRSPRNVGDACWNCQLKTKQFIYLTRYFILFYFRNSIEAALLLDFVTSEFPSAALV